MYRINSIDIGTIKEFKNGNLNIKLNPETLKEIESGKTSDIENISWLLDTLDCYFIGEEFSLSNFDMGANIYNCHSDIIYIISFSDVENVLKAGKTLKLYGRKPDKGDREVINEWETQA